MNIKFILVIIVVFLLFSCSTIKDYRLKYLKSKYEREYYICEDILNGSIKLDSVLKDESIADSSLIRRYKQKLIKYEWLSHLIKSGEFKLAEINEYEVSSYNNINSPEYDNFVDIVLTTPNKEAVICFRFIYRYIGNKLLGVIWNPSKYYKHIRPKIERPDTPYGM